MKQDPYAWQQAQQRKNANLKRQGEIQQTQEENAGHPIWGKPTPFAESLDSAGQSKLSEKLKTPEHAPQELPRSPALRNYFITEQELTQMADHAYALTKPMVSVLESQLEISSEEERTRQHEDKHARAMVAIRRITSLQNASAKDRLHVNIRRIVDEFGRHKTDKFLAPKPQSISPSTTEMPGRAGPDTGSSEVQIAILTTKIRALAHALESGRGYKDKMNKRNLRLLLHRRQRLLRYMEKKEKGSERWTNLIEKIGLTPATWKGQIEV